MKLTLKQRKFCDYYMASGNATESAIKAGYSKKTAKQIGMENLTKPYLQEYIKNHSIKDEKKRIQSIKEGQEWLTKIINGELLEEESFYKDGELVEIKKKPKIDTMLKAREQLSRMQGAYLDKVEVNTNTQRVIIVNDVDEED